VSQVKVVALNIASSKQAKLPPVLSTIRQQAKSQLKELINNLFNNTDDALFELADRSQSDQQQEMYFDSMRIVRLHRKAVTTSFINHFSQSFEEILRKPAEPLVSDELEEEPTNYTLLDQDELEMSVAVAGIVSKVTSHYSLAIMQLTKRLDSLIQYQTLSERTNPLGPNALSTLFADCLENLDVPIKVRIILMKLFERFVMERMGTVYDQANQSLINADVLPDLRKTHKTQSRQAPPSPAAVEQMPLPTNQQGSAVNNNTSGFTFSTVQSLLAGSRGGEGYQGQGGGNGEFTGHTTSPSMNFNELVQTLSQIQLQANAVAINTSEVPQLSDIRHLVLNNAPGHESSSLAQADDDAVNFVGMLFDYILNDKNLAIPMKALIGRLQIPIVKLAIIDKSFFEKSAHPARTLLNELSSAGIGWSGAKELKRDALYNKIESVISRVLNEFNQNPEVFVSLLKELRAFVSKDNRRSVLVEQRVKESETGKAKTNGAKATVQALINQKACGLRLPSSAGRFISETWSRVLTLRCVKSGEHADGWMAGVATLDNLLWVLQPLSELVAVERRDSMVDSLLAEIDAGMTELGCQTEEIIEFTKWLEEHLVTLSKNDRAYLEEDERPELDLPLNVVEEIILTTMKPEDTKPIEPEFLAQIKALTEGTWVEISQENSQPLRCKLTTVTVPGHNYIFVNRRGMKVFEKTRMGIATLLKDNQLKIIDESQVFDRALQSVIGNLRQMQRDRS